MKLLLTEEIEFKPGTYSRCCDCSNYKYDECNLATTEFNCDSCFVIDNLVTKKDAEIINIEVK